MGNKGGSGGFDLGRVDSGPPVILLLWRPRPSPVRLRGRVGPQAESAPRVRGCGLLVGKRTGGNGNRDLHQSRNHGPPRGDSSLQCVARPPPDAGFPVPSTRLTAGRSRLGPKSVAGAPWGGRERTEVRGILAEARVFTTFAEGDPATEAETVCTAVETRHVAIIALLMGGSSYVEKVSDRVQRNGQVSG